MQYSIERNNQTFGPYDLSAIQIYVYEGKILLQDRVVSTNGENISVRDVLKRNNLKYKIKSGNILSQIQSLGLNLLLPKDSISFKTLKQDSKLIIISLVGLAPAFLIKITGATIVTFYVIALYFSLIWGLFFYSVFKTHQVSIKKTILIFFTVQILIFFSVFILDINQFNPFYKLIEEGNPLINKVIGFIFGVGIFEELMKLIPVYFFIKYSREPLLPQTVVFYGLISGIGFGVFEGVVYQIGVNSKLDYNTSFFMNIARLTSLPFLHAVWSGISSYFIAFFFLFPTKRYAMFLLAIIIPAILHGLYDVFTWSLIGLFIAYFGVALLIIYLKKAKDFQTKITF
jgi:RsiW-degrading membrane proteinase PrsW (M82 family)